MSKPLQFPIYRAINFGFPDTEAMKNALETDPNRIYARLGNPTVAQVEQQLQKLENRPAMLFGSGMAAISAVFLGFLKAGDRAIVDRRIYGGAASFLKFFAPRIGIEITWVMSEAELLEAMNRPAKLAYFESPTNPLLQVMGVQKICEKAREKGILTVFDNTLASPGAQRPFDLGVDIVVHSATKMLGGHHDLLAGVVLASQQHLDELFWVRVMLGGVLDPAAAHLLGRGLETFTLRRDRSHASALKIAQTLANWQARWPKLLKVNYPGLAGHPDHELAQSQMTSFGPVVSFDVGADFGLARRFADGLKHFTLAGSLGGTESLCALPALTTHAGWSEQNLAEAGLSMGMIRLSIGLECPDILLSDLEQSFSEVFA